MKKLDVQNLILDNSDIENKIQRIGLEILEDNIDQSKIILFGISDNGKLISQKLIDHINKISDIKIVLIDVTINNGSWGVLKAERESKRTWYCTTLLLLDE